MSDGRNQADNSPASALGMLVGLLARELGAAVAVIGGLTTGFCCLNASVPLDDRWKIYLIAGGIFVAVLVACRWRGSR